MPDVVVTGTPASTRRRTRRARRLELAAWLLLGLFAMLAFLGRDEVVKVHEVRVADAALAMARSGWPWSATPTRASRPRVETSANGSRLVTRDDGETTAVNPWLVPVFEHHVRLQKPPLPYWCAAVLDRLLGEGALAARLVPATLGALSGGLIYLLARRLRGRRAANVAVAIWTSSHFVLDEHRKAMADPYLAATSLAAIVAWIEASSSSHAARRDALVMRSTHCSPSARSRKGPPVFLHVGVASVALASCHRRRPHASWIAHGVGVATFCAVALPWPVYVVARVPGVIELWRFESIGEFADNQRNARPLWFYGPQLLLIAAPWTVGHAIAGVVGAAGVVVAIARADVSIAATLVASTIVVAAALATIARDAPVGRWFRVQAVAFATVVAAIVNLPGHARPPPAPPATSARP